MSKPWVGYIAVGFLFLAGVLECIGGSYKLGIFFMVLSIISLCLRIYFNKKLKDEQRRNKGL
ncbi:MAG: hypothetical protein JNL60_03365 [Bacteroidia bacterium]|nr:hypothetical protein [Bacteroidia bacterium]